MDKKGSKFGLFCKNVLLAMLICVAILVIVVLSLKWYTNHGREVKVPEVTSLSLEEAESLLQSSNLKLEVIDSVYSNNVPMGTVVEQTPPTGTMVKENRAIYVVINASSKRMVAMPEVRDMSYRQAKNILLQMGFKVNDAVLVPSEFKDLVLDISVNRNSIKAGEKVAEGTLITLIVGEGFSDVKEEVPNVIGLNILEAKSELLDKHLAISDLEYDIEPTEENEDSYYVYFQDPSPGTEVEEGTAVQLKLSLDKGKSFSSNTSTTVEEDDDFF